MTIKISTKVATALLFISTLFASGYALGRSEYSSSCAVILPERSIIQEVKPNQYK